MGSNSSRDLVYYNKLVRDCAKINDECMKQRDNEMQIVVTKLNEVLNNLDALSAYYIEKGYAGFVLYETDYLKEHDGRSFGQTLNKTLETMYHIGSYSNYTIFFQSAQPVFEYETTKGRIVVSFLKIHGVISVLKMIRIHPYQEQLPVLIELQPVPQTESV